MLRRIGWTLPLLLGALVCLAGCTFPKSFGFARKQPPQPETQVAEDRAAADGADTEAEGRQTVAGPVAAQDHRLVLVRPPQAGRYRQAALGGQPRRQQATASQPLAYPNVVPPKYRNMDTAVPNTSLAKDTSGTPSLVRPSRRPPPDPGRNRRSRRAQEDLLAEQPPRRRSAVRPHRGGQPVVAHQPE